jgi:hypothetical protein
MAEISGKYSSQHMNLFSSTWIVYAGCRSDADVPNWRSKATVYKREYEREYERKQTAPDQAEAKR